MGLAKAIAVDACEGVIGCSNEDMGGSGGCFVLDELDEGDLNEIAELFVTGVGVVVVEGYCEQVYSGWFGQERQMVWVHSQQCDQNLSTLSRLPNFSKILDPKHIVAPFVSHCISWVHNLKFFA